MMVNPMINESSLPWQSTVPQTMPWMSSYPSSGMVMPFGHPQVCNAVNSQIQPHLSTMPEHQVHPTVTQCESTRIGIDQNPISNNITQRAEATYPCPSQISHPDSQFLTCQTSIPQQHPPSYFTSNYLIEMPAQTSCTAGQASSNASVQIPSQTNKRSSIEMEDEPIDGGEPPSKQLLSEKKLFKKFGSLHLNSAVRLSSETDSDDSENDDKDGYRTKSTFAQGREEFNKYVYLLFKDKDGKSNIQPSYSTIERLAREERDKLSKALVLWNPPLSSHFGVQESSSDDEEFHYKDHRDFLKPRESSVIITEVTDDESFDCRGLPTRENAYCQDPDDMMSE